MVPAFLSTIALLLLVGCGGEDAPPPDQACAAAGDVTAAVGTSAVATAVAIAAVDDRFEPRCIEVEPGQLTIVVRNDGRHPHNLALPDGASVAVDAGQVAILEATVPDAGLRYTCTIHPGMDGELKVR